MSTKSESMELTNQHIDKMFIKFGLCLFLFGMLLPNDWRQKFGMLSTLISWVAGVIPSINKVAAISPISELVQGFFGAAFLFVLIFYAIVMRRQEMAGLGSRFKHALHRAQSKFKFWIGIYVIAIPTLALILYLILFFPGEVHLGLTPTRGQAIFSLLVSYRFTLALFGTLLMLGVCAFLWLLTMCMIGPLLYFIERRKNNGN